jgi:putrescine transport system substrate-binding protein
MAQGPAHSGNRLRRPSVGIKRQLSTAQGAPWPWRRLTLAAVLLALLGACGGESSEAPPRSGAQVNFYNWSNYIHPDTLPAFTAQTGIRVVYDVYDSNDVLEGKLLAGNTGYDLVVPTSNFFRNQRTVGLFQPIDRSRLGNYRHLDPTILARLTEIDPDNAYAIPYAWGTTGLGVNLTRIRERLPDAPLDSWALLFDPEVVRHLQDCGVTLVDASDELAEIGLNYLGLAPQSTDVDELRAAMQLVQTIRPYVRYFHSSQYIDDFANGEVCLVLGWSGDIFQAIDNARPGLELDYVIPREGTVLWFDLLAIPADAPNVDNAHLLLDHLLDPRIGAGLTNETFFPGGNSGALQWINPEIRDDPSIFPPAEVMARLFVHPVHSPDYVRQRNRLWTTVKTGR